MEYEYDFLHDVSRGRKAKRAMRMFQRWFDREEHLLVWLTRSTLEPRAMSLPLCPTDRLYKQAC